MAKKKKTIPSGLLMALLLAVAVILGSFLVYDQFNKLNAVKDIAATEKVEMQNARAELERLKELQEPQMREQLALLERLMPVQPDENILIADINAVSMDSDTHLMQIRFEQRGAKQNYTEMPFKIVFEGQYHGLLELLGSLQTGERAVRINEVKVGKGKEELPQIKAEIAASAFFTGQE